MMILWIPGVSHLFSIWLTFIYFTEHNQLCLYAHSDWSMYIRMRAKEQRPGFVWLTPPKVFDVEEKKKRKCRRWKRKTVKKKYSLIMLIFLSYIKIMAQRLSGEKRSFLDCWQVSHKQQVTLYLDFSLLLLFLEKIIICSIVKTSFVYQVSGYSNISFFFHRIKVYAYTM
jgi:hypothetical protein